MNNFVIHTKDKNVIKIDVQDEDNLRFEGLKSEDKPAPEPAHAGTADDSKANEDTAPSQGV